MFRFLKNLFSKSPGERTSSSGSFSLPRTDEGDRFVGEKTSSSGSFSLPRMNEGDRFVWCLVGNIIDLNAYGEEKELRLGTKHFSPGTKVYCLPAAWGDGYEKIKVIGRHRGTRRLVCMVIPSKLITNWRLQKVYRPYVLNVMRANHGWTNSEKDKQRILDMLNWLPERTFKLDI